MEETYPNILPSPPVTQEVVGGGRSKTQIPAKRTVLLSALFVLLTFLVVITQSLLKWLSELSTNEAAWNKAMMMAQLYFSASTNHTCSAQD